MPAESDAIALTTSSSMLIEYGGCAWAGLFAGTPAPTVFAINLLGWLSSR